MTLKEFLVEKWPELAVLGVGVALLYQVYDLRGRTEGTSSSLTAVSERVDRIASTLPEVGARSAFFQINQNYGTAIVAATAQQDANKPILALFDRANGKTTIYSLPNWSSDTGPAALMAVSGAMITSDDNAISFSQMEGYSTELRTNLYAPANIQKKYSWLSTRDSADMEKAIQQLGFTPIQSKTTDWMANWSSMPDILKDQNRNPFKSP